MLYSDLGFRGVYKCFTALMKESIPADWYEKFPDADKADCILTYGYVDREAGLTLDVLGVANLSANLFFDAPTDFRFMLRIGAVMEKDLIPVEDPDGALRAKYAERLSWLDAYKASDEVEKTRAFRELDASRDREMPDDVLVYLTAEGLNPEGCWVRITGLGDRWIMGTLLNEPEQEYPYHLGEQIAFFIGQDEEHNYYCWTDMTPDPKLTAEDLADGSLLKKAVSAFNRQCTLDNHYEVLSLLRDSTVWVPCNAVLSDADMSVLEKAAASVGTPENMVGMSFQTQDDVRMIPDILQQDGKYYFPVFSSAEEMGKYGERFSKIAVPFLQTVHMAMATDRYKLSGIVLNAFSEPFILPADLFDLMDSFKTRIDP